MRRVLLNSPDSPESTIQIAKLGDFTDPRYGDFSITKSEVEEWKRNLDLLPGNEALIDFDHLSDKPSPHRRTDAAGWISDVFLDGDNAMAHVEWSKAGREAIEEKRFKFFSPAYGPHTDEQGREYNNVLSGGALSNKPFLNMATVQLASEDRVKQAMLDELDSEHLKRLLDAIASVSTQWADSRPAMLTKDILKTLGIEDEDAQKKILDLATAEKPDEKKVLDAIEAAKPEPPEETTEEKPEPKTLEQQAKDAGKIVLDAETVNKLTVDASAGRKAMEQLNSERFTNAFTKALDAGKAVAAEKEDQEHFYSLDADRTIKALEAREPIVNVKPRGQNLPTDDLDAPQGVQPQAFQLDQEVKKHMADKDMSPEEYVKALHEVEAKGRQL